jgi:hypothetical protein
MLEIVIAGTGESTSLSPTIIASAELRDGGPFETGNRQCAV